MLCPFQLFCCILSSLGTKATAKVSNHSDGAANSDLPSSDPWVNFTREIRSYSTEIYQRARHVYPRGHCNIIFVKVPKCASSTTGGIARRIAAHQGLSGVRYRRWITSEKEPGVWANHNKASVLWPLVNLLKKPTFIFTFIRDPVDRCLSAYYYFRAPLSRGPPAIITEQKISALAQCRNAMFDYINPKEPPTLNMTTTNDVRRLVNGVIQAYDFIGVTGDGIFDESVHLLIRSELRLPLQDGLYLSSKMSGGGRDSLAGVRHLPLAEEPHEVQSFAIGSKFKKRSALDLELVKMVTTSIRITYAHNPDLQSSLATFIRLRSTAEASCPIDWSKFSSTNWVKSCYWADNGCGYKCLDGL